MMVLSMQNTMSPFSNISSDTDKISDFSYLPREYLINYVQRKYTNKLGHGMIRSPREIGWEHGYAKKQCQFVPIHSSLLPH